MPSPPAGEGVPLGDGIWGHHPVRDASLVAEAEVETEVEVGGEKVPVASSVLERAVERCLLRLLLLSLVFPANFFFFGLGILVGFADSLRDDERVTLALALLFFGPRLSGGMGVKQIWLSNGGLMIWGGLCGRISNAWADAEYLSSSSVRLSPS